MRQTPTPEAAALIFKRRGDVTRAYWERMKLQGYFRIKLRAKASIA